MTHQGTVEASTCEKSDASLLAQQLDSWLASADSLRTAAGVHLACIPSTYKALRDLGTFTFLSLHLFSAAGKHASALVDILRLIERL